MKTLSSQLKLNKISLLAGLGLSVVLIANTAHANTPKTFTAQEQADLMAKGMWYDERTGLIWDRCFLGQTWNGVECVGEIGRYKITTGTVRNGVEAFTPVNLKEIVSQHKLGGFRWTLPTRIQLHTIVDCPNGYRNGSFSLTANGQEYRYNSECGYNDRYALDKNTFPLSQQWKGSLWVATADMHQAKVFFDVIMLPYIYDLKFNTGSESRGNISHPHRDSKVAIKPVVTANSLDMNAYKKLLVDDRGVFTQTIIDNEKAEEVKKKAEAERLAREKAAREAEQARKEQEAYDKKVANFRKNLKVGDDASAGMVIEIKGDLIKIQTNDRQCSQKDYNGKCMNYVNTPVEKWVKRRELYPAN